MSLITYVFWDRLILRVEYLFMQWFSSENHLLSFLSSHHLIVEHEFTLMPFSERQEQQIKKENEITVINLSFC